MSNRQTYSATITIGKALAGAFQTDLDYWADGLIATGGAISPEKSFCNLIDFKWDGFN